MKYMKTIVPAVALTLTVLNGALAEETTYTAGVVKKVKPEDGKVTIIHEELVALDMPAMTMVFRTATPEMLEKLEPGQEIEFVAERVNGKLTVTKIKE